MLWQDYHDEVEKQFEPRSEDDEAYMRLTETELGLPRSYPGYNPEHCLVADPKPKTFTNGR